MKIAIVGKAACLITKDFQDNKLDFDGVCLIYSNSLIQRDKEAVDICWFAIQQLSESASDLVIQEALRRVFVYLWKFCKDYNCEIDPSGNSLEDEAKIKSYLKEIETKPE